MLRDSAKEFIDRTVIPNRERLKRKIMLTEECKERNRSYGLLGISVPESYGGLGMGFVTTMLACDYLSGATGSLATAYGAHTGIGTLPILLYGTEAQKQKYLPDLATGAKFGAYCLTEPDAGSDANSGKLRQDFQKMVNIISSTVKKCGFLMQVLQIPSLSLLK